MKSLMFDLVWQLSLRTQVNNCLSCHCAGTCTCNSIISQTACLHIELVMKTELRWCLSNSIKTSNKLQPRLQNHLKIYLELLQCKLLEKKIGK